MCGAINACIYGINYDIDDYAEHTSSLANEIYELEVVCLGKYQRALDEKHSQRTFLFEEGNISINTERLVFFLLLK